METSIKNRHNRKLQRDNVNAVIVGKNQGENKLQREKREKKKRNKCSFKELKRLKKTPLTKTLSICQKEI